MRKLMIVALFVAACGGSKKADPSTPTSSADPQPAAGSATGDGVECAKEIALVCPDGQIDGCLKTPQEGTTHACVAN